MSSLARTRASAELASPVLARSVALAALIAGADTIGRSLAASRLGVPAPVSAGMMLCTTAVIALILIVCEAVRPQSVRLALAALILWALGDVFAARLALASSGHASAAPSAALIAAGVFIAVVAVLSDISRLEALGRPLTVAGLALIGAPLLPMLGHTVNGARILVGFGGFELMPGEIGRPLLMVGVAARLAGTAAPLSVVERGWRRALPNRDLLLDVLAAPALGVLLGALEGDLGPPAILTLAFGVTIALATNLRRYLAATLALTLSAFALGAKLSGQLHTRLLDVSDPLRLVHGGFVQAGLARLAEAWGGWLGTGLGGSLSVRPGAVPDQSTDYILALITAELGFIGLLAVLGLLAWLLAEAWRTAARSHAGFDHVAAVALCSLLSVQTVWIAGAALGFLPLTGVTTPMLSAGGSAHIALALILGLLACTHGAGERGRFARQELALLGQQPRRAANAGAMCVLALAAIGIGATASLSAAQTTLDRRPDNPFRAQETQRRGEILSADGSSLANSTGTSSLDRVARHDHAGSLAPLVGFTSATNAGDGIEQAWGAMLRCGGSGQAPLTPASGAEGATRVLGNPARCVPAALVLTASQTIQRAAVSALAGRPGAVVVLDAHTGAVQAAYASYASAPDADPLFTLLPPGSTFKMITAAASLSASIATTTPLNRGYQSVGGGWLSNNANELCGGTLAQAFAASCNGSFARLAHVLGAVRLDAMARDLGFDSPMTLSGLAGAESSTGLSASASDQLLAASSIGQGEVVATPLQIALIVATVANGGRSPTPRLVAGACASGQPILTTSSPRRRALSPTVAATLLSAMRLAVTSGSARGLAALPGDWAAKTGTAQAPRLVQTGSPAGTIGWIAGTPTGFGGGYRPVVVAVLLPTPAAPDQSSAGAAEVLAALAPSLHPDPALDRACADS